MKRNIIIVLFGLIVLYSLYRCVYKPNSLRKEVKISAEKLRVGSYIFVTQIKHNGSQSFEKGYAIFKVTQIMDDFVRLAVVRKFFASQKAFDVRIFESDGYFSATKGIYKDAKQTIINNIVTAVKSEDIGHYNHLVLTDSLRSKYPTLVKSRLFVEDVSNDIKPTKESPIYGDKTIFFNLVYSKKEMINKGQLVTYIYRNSFAVDVELKQAYSNNIDKIINLNN